MSMKAYIAFLITIFAGLLVPFLVLEALGLAVSEEWYATFLIVTIPLTVAGANKIGRRNQKLKAWANAKATGAATTFFVGALCASAAAALLASLPLPGWLLGVLGAALAVAALGSLVLASERS